MQEELNHLHDTATQLLGEHLGNWADSLLNAGGGHSDSRFIEALHALLTVRAALAPLVGNAQDASHG
ncbi:hypothetical protein [Chromobacterium phragmitis]|uniref:Uncharacterized protein n=1 Tax=Chromobacterium phragmitis TaxID=2202141 RepID=A0A344UHR8_9NEIS|nr:hypothetical protein [Chromobacterium phragmitis]AXE34816.1 hypothetical protein DK843_11245 [Chromobacterium phragmitis]